MIKPMAEEINLLRKRNLNLHRTRDLLLPKLISGEVDIESIDIIVQEVTPLKPS